MLGDAEVNIVKRGATVRLGFRNSVDEHPHATRRAGVGAVTRPARPKATNDQPNVAVTVARLDQHARNAGERGVETISAEPLPGGLVNLGDGERSDNQWKPTATGGDRHRRQRGLGRVLLRSNGSGGERREHGHRTSDFHPFQGWENWRTSNRVLNNS